LTTISRALASRGKKHMPTAYLPGSGNVTPVSLAHSRNSASGIWIRMPAPSPTSGSAAHRAAMVQVDKKLKPLADDLMDFWPLMLATKPTPHESCSLRGS